MNAKTITKLLFAIVLAAPATVYAVERSIQVAIEDGQSAAQFKIGDSRCVLINDQIVCRRMVTK